RRARDADVRRRTGGVLATARAARAGVAPRRGGRPCPPGGDPAGPPDPNRSKPPPRRPGWAPPPGGRPPPPPRRRRRRRGAARAVAPARVPSFTRILAHRGERTVGPLALTLGVLLIALTLLALQAALGLVFDPRYRDFPFAALTAAVVPFALLTLRPPRRKD